MDHEYYMPGFGWKQAVKMGIWFGAFQCLMPLLGWFLGSGVSQYIEAVDHWIAFGLLAFIGGKMLLDALSGGGDEPESTDLSPRRLCESMLNHPFSRPRRAVLWR